ncbi:hypothetical protein [Natrinema halophilum]|uniref:Uncharacterized protein n=1 Tax=Natrinema halophilum TaxID=1699371 RepID=A0A7D5KYA2_9EURY|nr:hypothetical protein [Natrinema halophilum]QLG50322.1 hypothetical protein HYG82_16470 [Natrinema halophilum]
MTDRTRGRDGTDATRIERRSVFAAIGSAAGTGGFAGCSRVLGDDSDGPDVTTDLSVGVPECRPVESTANVTFDGPTIVHVDGTMPLDTSCHSVEPTVFGRTDDHTVVLELRTDDGSTLDRMRNCGECSAEKAPMAEYEATVTFHGYSPRDLYVVHDSAFGKVEVTHAYRD